MFRTNRPRLLCLWLPNWPIQRWLAARRDSSGDGPEADLPASEGLGPGEAAAESQSAAEPPLILWGQDARRGRVVVARCQQAQQLGVRPGMTLSQADSLVRGALRGAAAQKRGASPPASPPLGSEPSLVPHDGQADLDALHELAERCAEQLSPLVAVEALDPFLWAGQPLHQPQSLLLDVTGIEALHGGEAALLRAAARVIAGLGYSPRMAIAGTVGAAWAVSHYMPPREQPPAPLQRVLDDQTPAWIVPAGAESEALDCLPTAALRLPSETTAMLRRLGVGTIAELRRLPRSGLASRLGVDLLQRLDQALGERDEPLQIHHAAAANQARLELEYPTQDRQILEHRLELLVHRVADHLARHHHGALRMSCRFDLQQADSVEMRLGLFKPTAVGEHLTRLFHGHLERQRLVAPVCRITVTATMIGPLGVRQPRLISMPDDPATTADDLARLVDTLSGRLGRQRVLGSTASYDPLPEAAVTWRPLTGQPVGALVPGRPASRRSARRTSRKRRPSSRGTADKAATDQQFREGPTSPLLASGRDPLRRPLELLPQPQPLTPLENASRQDSAAARPPSRFRRGGRPLQIVRHWGPERLETGWWYGPLQRRDYYRAETSEGQWLWIYHDLREDAWYLHGFFG